MEDRVRSQVSDGKFVLEDYAALKLFYSPILLNINKNV